MPYSFATLPTDQFPSAGGKASKLAQMYQRHYPVPNGLVLLPSDFDGDDIRAAAWAEVQKFVANERQRNTQAAFAVRSSAQSEDSGQASFAGEFETVLNMRSDDEIRHAIQTVRSSRHNARAAAYSSAQGFDTAHEMAVIVQGMVQPTVAGVLFTADPLTGSLIQMTGNFVQGLGEKLVSGEATPQIFTLHWQTGKYDGPAALKPFARQLHRLAQRLDIEFGAPQDIEWAIAERKIAILQTRPITTLREFNPITGEINASLLGDFLWSNGNAAEIQPEVMPLFTWSITKLWGYGHTSWWSRYPASGNIGGRSYFNISVQVAPFASLPGGLKNAMRYVGEWWGRIPAETTIPLMPFSICEVLFNVLPMSIQSFRRMAQYRQQIAGFVQNNPTWCKQMRARIAEINNPAGLVALWQDELKPYFGLATTLAGAANSNMQTLLQTQLTKLVGAEDANALISNLGGAGHLTSVGPLVGLAQVVGGALSPEAYLENYGHRGPYEFDPSRPQPVDDPSWLQHQLTDFAKNPVDVEALLQKQRANFAAAWQRLCKKHPNKAKKIEKQLAQAAHLAQQREAARSEVTRTIGVLRAFALHAAALTGVGEDVFHLNVDELIEVLQGDLRVCRYLPKRKETYTRYCALPPYPPVISGRFDPFAWAADPQRRNDLYDAHVTPSVLPTSKILQGFAGAAGLVEGTVRRIDHAEDGHLLQPGEILVTVTTNIGWTPLFPRAAAIITDVGAPLSHAAIVARELGIPAVIGCQNATSRLQTGDRVRVNGAQGTVEIL